MRRGAARPTVTSMGAAVELEAGGRTVRLSSPDKVYFPERGFTKLDVARYYLAVGEGITRVLRDRPTTLERFPEGVGGESFFQKRAPKNLPDWIPTAHITFPSGRQRRRDLPDRDGRRHLGGESRHAHLPPLAGARAGDLDHPDELRIDLDPQPGTDFGDAVTAAHELRAFLEDQGLRGWPKTSGGRGLHVFVPIEPRWTFTEVRRAAIAVGRELELRMPGRVTTAWWKEERGEKIFVDYNQTARDRTIACAYSVRPRPHAPVSAPLRWDELDGIGPRDFDIAHHARPLSRTGRCARGHGGARVQPGRPAGAGRPARAGPGLGDMPYPPDYPKAPGEPKRVAPSRAKRAK